MQRLRQFLFLLILFGFGGHILLGQNSFKYIFSPDSTSFSSVGGMDARGLVYTGLPGREIAVSGKISGADTAGYALAVYLLQLDTSFQTLQFDYYHDDQIFLAGTPFSNSLAFDGQDNYFLSTTSADSQIVICADTNGNLEWNTSVRHHTFDDGYADGNTITVVGQDEDQLAGHNLNIVQMDESGQTIKYKSIGSLEFDIPMAIGKMGSGFVVTGQVAGGSYREILIARVDADFNMEWGHVFQYPNRNALVYDMVVSPDEQSLYLTGEVAKDATHSSDSVFIAKINSMGDVLWFNTYGSDTLPNLIANTIEITPNGEKIVVGGDFDATGWRSSFVLSVDSAGSVRWANDYRTPDTTMDESVEAIAVSPTGDFFAFSGSYHSIRPGQPAIRNIYIAHADMDSGKVGCERPLLFGMRTDTLADVDVVFTRDPGVLPTIPYSYVHRGGTVNDSMLCEKAVIVATEEERTVNFEVVNPVRSTMVVDLNAGLFGGQIELYDLQGRLMLHQAAIPGSMRYRIPVGEITHGIYILRFSGKDGLSATRKVWLQP